MSHPTLRDWLSEGPYALSLSAGFFGFFAHTGVVSVLEAEGLVPARLSGASAGALMAGLWASGLDSARLERELVSLRREEFWDPSPGPGLLRGRLFRAKLESILAGATFEQARVPVQVSVFDVLGRRTEVVGKGPLAPAIHASCALPVLFQPVWMNRRPYSDGGIADRPGLVAHEGEPRVLYHHLASRSPWRRRTDPALAIPKRPGLVTVVVENLPRVNPFALARGAEALGRARDAFRQALERPIVDGVVRI